MVDNLASLMINDAEIYVLPAMNILEVDPEIEKLYIFLGVDGQGNGIFEEAPKWLLDMANDQLYKDIMGQYEEDTAFELDEYVEDSSG